jgi:homoserine dehydrogenase
LMIQDKPGALADIARILATRHISIASVMQHEALDDQEGSMVPLVIMTHLAPTSNFVSTIHELDSLDCVEAPCVYFPVGE